MCVCEGGGGGGGDMRSVLLFVDFFTHFPSKRSEICYIFMVLSR